jgi:carboxylesterase
MQNSIPNIMPGAEPFFFRGSSVGCLCLHGFTASPAEVRWLGEHLAGAGFTVYGARLPGHGTHYRDLARYRWQDWYAGGLDGYHLLKANCEQIFLVGHSMGGMLALLLGANVAVNGIVALAVPIIFRSRTMAQARRLKYVMPFTDQTDRSSLPGVIRAEQRKRGEPAVGRVRYNIWSTAAVGELYALAGVVYEHLPQITAPLLLVNSAADKTVSLENRDIIQSRVKSKLIESQTLQNSDHILPQDIEREAVFAWVSDFIQRQQKKDKV